MFMTSSPGLDRIRWVVKITFYRRVSYLPRPRPVPVWVSMINLIVYFVATQWYPISPNILELLFLLVTSIFEPVSLCLFLPICLSVVLSLCLSTSLSECSAVSMFVYLTVWVQCCPYVCLPHCLSAVLSNCPPDCLSVVLSVFINSSECSSVCFYQFVWV